MICPKCHTENPDDSKFCKKCGLELNPNPSQDVTIISQKHIFNDYLINNRFKIIKVLGKGGMGEILLAEDLKLKRKVAIKKISKDSIYGDESKARFIREAQTASQLDHPNICTIFEVYDEEENDYIVMQYIEGANLDQIIKIKPLALDKIIDISIQICDGMIAAHEKNIIHRDLKPSNIMIDLNGRVKILDFGLAKFNTSKVDTGITTNLTSKGVVLGTVSYMSPEQARGGDLDYRTDIFSFGLILYEMIERKNPFSEKEQINTLYNVLNKQVEFEREIPEKLKEIILKTLEKDRNKRYKSFKEVRRDLKDFYDNYRNRKQEIEYKTEIIDSTELIDISDENKIKTSDSQDLREIVKNVNRLKASTQAISSIKRKKNLYLSALVILLILVVSYVILFKLIPNINKKKALKTNYEKYYVYLDGIINKTKDRNIAKKIVYLLNYSLNQFDKFKLIDNSLFNTIKRLNKKTGKNSIPVFKIKGDIEEFNGIYNLNFYFSDFNEKNKSLITITGKGRDSILKHQIDSLSERVYLKVNDSKNKVNIKKVSDYFGTSWKNYSFFYKGVNYYKKLDMAKAQKYLDMSGESVASKYYKALVYYFNGNRKNSLELIKSVVKDDRKLTKPVSLRINSFYSRLIFDFKNEVKYLEELKNDFFFSKSVFYDLGEAYFHHGMPVKAIKYYLKALEIDNKFSNALNHLGYCYSYIGEHNKAIDSFEKYRVLDQSANSFDSLGDGYFYSGDYINAEAMKIAAVKKDENGVPWSYLTLSDIYLLKRDYNNSFKSLNRYSELKKDKYSRATFLSKLAFVYYYKGDYEKSLEYINKAIENYDSKDITDNSSEYHWIKALVLFKLKNYKEFENEFLWIEELKNKYNLSENNFYIPYKYYLHLKALNYEIKNDISDANLVYKKLISIKNSLSYWITFYNYQYFHTEYVRFLIRNHMKREANDELEKCLNFNPNYPPALEMKSKF